MFVQKIPLWLYNTKRISAKNCISIYNEKLGSKLGTIDIVSFEECKKEIAKQKISSIKEYQSKRKPNWPSSPNNYYKEFVDWYDFFGKNKPEFLSFEECRKQVRKKRFKSVEEYQNNRNPNWPSSPNNYYKEFVDWYDFFGKNKPKFLSFKECRKQVRKKRFKSVEEYQNNRNSNWPSNPNKCYEEFAGWHDFFGKNKPEFLSFEECRKQVKKCKFRSMKEYKNKRRPEWPSCPESFYKEFVSSHDFLGKGFLSFEECRKQVRRMRFRGLKEYENKRRPDWPRDPSVFYKEFKDWYDFLGKNKRQFLSFEECRAQVRKCNFKDMNEYKKNMRSNWPRRPESYYKEFISSYDFLGTEFLSFEECRKQVRRIKFKTVEEYQRNKKINWPSSPYLIYKDQGWKNWYDFLGKKKAQFLSFEECRKEVQKAKIKNKTDYQDKRKENWPSRPELTYKNKWENWVSFLFSSEFARKRKRCPKT